MVDRGRLKKFQDLTLKVAAYYDGQEAVKGRYVNGRQTLNENIADLGALALCHLDCRR